MDPDKPPVPSPREHDLLSRAQLQPSARNSRLKPFPPSPRVSPSLHCPLPTCTTTSHTTPKPVNSLSACCNSLHILLPALQDLSQTHFSLHGQKPRPSIQNFSRISSPLARRLPREVPTVPNIPCDKPRISLLLYPRRDLFYSRLSCMHAANLILSVTVSLTTSTGTKINPTLRKPASQPPACKDAFSPCPAAPLLLHVQATPTQYSSRTPSSSEYCASLRHPSPRSQPKLHCSELESKCRFRLDLEETGWPLGEDQEVL